MIYIDATGSVIQNRPSSKKTIYYYVAVMEVNTKCPPIPVIEFIFENHTFSKITSTLQQFKYDLNKLKCKDNPKIIEVDFSLAINHSIISVFAKRASHT